MSERLEQLRGALLVQCTAAQAFDALTLADHRAGAGVVVCTRKRSEVWALADAAGRAVTSLLVDAERYKGKARLLGSERFDPGWLRSQREAAAVRLACLWLRLRFARELLRHADKPTACSNGAWQTCRRPPDSTSSHLLRGGVGSDVPVFVF